MPHDPVKPIELRYRSRTVAPVAIEEELRLFWEALERDSALRDRVAAAGFELEAVLEVDRDGAITVGRDRAGLDPASTAIVIAFAPVAAGIVHDLWKKIILPRIERRYGVGSLRPAGPSSSEDG